jgi:serine protease
MSFRALMLVLSSALALASLPLRSAEASSQLKTIPHLTTPETGRVIVKYRSGASVLSSSGSRSLSTSSNGKAQVTTLRTASALGQKTGLTLSDGRTLGDRTQVLKGTGLTSQVLADRLSKNSDVEWAVVDGRRFASYTPDDPLYPNGLSSSVNSLTVGQWYLRSSSSTLVSAIDATTAWDTTQGSSSVVVAVLDTGITDHSDLNDKILSGYDFISDSEVANDGDGRDSDPSDPGDWITSSEDASGTFVDCGESDSTWHGTMVSGVVGASTNNSVGIAGVAPNVKILPVRVLGKCGGYDSDIIAGMKWAAGISVSGITDNSNPAKVINLSLGGTGSCSTAYTEAISAVTAEGASVVVAAGNEYGAVTTPANCSGVIAVASVSHAGTKAWYSSYGTAVTISAPGGDCGSTFYGGASGCTYGILTTTNAGTTSPTTESYTNASNYAIGTSFAAPVVSGVAALMYSQNSNLTPAKVKSLLQSTATTFPTSGAVMSNNASTCSASASEAYECYCTTTTCGAGMLNAAAAVAAADTATVPTAAITASATTVLPSSSVTLDGSGSTAEGSATIASYAWSVTSGVTLADFSGSTTSSTATLVAGSTAGTVTVSLKVTDSNGETNTTTQSIRIVTGAPTVSFTVSDSSPDVGDTVTLDGSASAAQGSATIASYQWAITDGSSHASFSGSTTGSTAALTTSSKGTVKVSLTVTDSDGFSTTSTQSIKVGGSSGGGGGAWSPLWGAVLLAWGWLLGRRPRRQQQV